jgi:glutamine synthetase
MSAEYGVKYTPSTVQKTTPLANVSIDDLKSMGIEYIRLQWVDLINNIRYRVIPLSYFAKILESPRPSISITKCVFGLVFITLAPGFSALGEYLYVPDMNTLRLCPYADGHASVMGWFEEKVPVKGPDGIPSVTVPLCPRTTLKRVVEEAKASAGVEFLVGFETEFILLKSTSPIEAVNNHGWSNSPKLPSGSVETKVLQEIAKSLQESGVELQMYHAEAAPGQYEVITGPLPPLEAADALIHTRETIANVASKHGLRATLAPRVYLDNCGSAAHTHISVHSTRPPSPNAPPTTDGLTSHESAFLSSLLAHLPALTALTLPLPASYKRMIDGVWSGGTYVCWGTDNREAPVRLCNASSPSSRNFEVKCHDGLANPYLSLAGMLGAGSVGVKEGQKLRMGNCDGQTAANMGEAGRKALGITQRMSLTWEESRKAFGADEVVRNVLGNEVVDTYLAVNEHLAKQMDAGTEEGSLLRLVENY